jgi:hypothetical protein
MQHTPDPGLTDLAPGAERLDAIVSYDPASASRNASSSGSSIE